MLDANTVGVPSRTACYHRVFTGDVDRTPDVRDSFLRADKRYYGTFSSVSTVSAW